MRCIIRGRKRGQGTNPLASRDCERRVLNTTARISVSICLFKFLQSIDDVYISSVSRTLSTSVPSILHYSGKIYLRSSFLAPYIRIQFGLKDCRGGVSVYTPLGCASSFSRTVPNPQDPPLLLTRLRACFFLLREGGGGYDEDYSYSDYRILGFYRRMADDWLMNKPQTLNLGSVKQRPGDPSAYLALGTLGTHPLVT